LDDDPFVGYLYIGPPRPTYYTLLGLLPPTAPIRVKSP
jgi:hypothetical protein